MPHGDFVSGTDASVLTGFSLSTLRKHANSGAIDTIRTPGNCRRYSLVSLRSLVKTSSVPTTSLLDLPPSDFSGPREDVVYCRVSTPAQRGGLENQVALMQQRHPGCRVFTDIGSGLNFKRKGLRSVLELCISRRLGRLFVSHRDRLCRFAFELLQWIFTRHGAEIVVQDEESSSPKDEFTDDLLAVITVFTARHNGAKNYKRALQAIEGTSPAAKRGKQKASHGNEEDPSEGGAANLEDQDAAVGSPAEGVEVLVRRC